MVEAVGWDVTAPEIAARLFDHPTGASALRVQKAFALAARSGCHRAFSQALSVEAEARGVTLDQAATRAAFDERVAALQAGERRARDANDARRLAYFQEALVKQQEMIAAWETTPV